MGTLEIFKIDLKGMAAEETAYEFTLDSDYFNKIGATEVKDGHLNATLLVRKTAGEFELDFHIEGGAVVVCDLCLDDVTLPVSTDKTVVVKMGDTFEDDDEVVIVPADEGVIDVAWLLYEMVVLSLPTRHVHEEGGCNPVMMEKLQSMTPSAADASGQDGDSVDPRWSKLEKLKSTIK